MSCINIRSISLSYATFFPKYSPSFIVCPSLSVIILDLVIYSVIDVESVNNESSICLRRMSCMIYLLVVLCISRCAVTTVLAQYTAPSYKPTFKPTPEPSFTYPPTPKPTTHAPTNRPSSQPSGNTSPTFFSITFTSNLCSLFSPSLL